MLKKEMQTPRDKWESLPAEATQIATQRDILLEFKNKHSRRKKKTIDSMMRPHKRRQFRTLQQQSFVIVFFTAMDNIIGDLDTRF